MNQRALQSILEIKAALMGEKSARVAAIRNKLAQQRAECEAMKQAISAPPEADSCVATLQATSLWKQSQTDLLFRMDEAISVTLRHLEVAENELAQALAEERAIKRLLGHKAE